MIRKLSWLVAIVLLAGVLTTSVIVTIVLGVLTTIGLVSALFSDGGFGDLLAGVCLAVPVVVGVWYGWMRRRAG